MVAVASGGRRWSGFAAGVSLVFLVLFFGSAGRWLPVSVLAGIIIHAALSLVELDIAAWARRRRTRRDAAVAVLVAAVTVGYNLMVAVGVGVVIAIMLFIGAQVTAPVIHRRTTAAHQRSLRQRSAEQAALLGQYGDRIVIYELRGALFFAKADQLFEELKPDLDRRTWVILHMRRVAQVDLTSIKILEQIATRLNRHGGELLCCEVHKEIGIGHRVHETLRKISTRRTAPEVKTFNGADEALEYAENALLSELGTPPTHTHAHIALADTDLCLDMDAEEVASLARVLQSCTLAASSYLFEAGEYGSEIYLVMHGEVEIRLRTGRRHYKRLAIYGPGTLFGEVAFLDPGARSADCVAVAQSELMKLQRADFDRLKQSHTDAAISVLVAIGKAQGRALRRNTEEIQNLAQW